MIFFDFFVVAQPMILQCFLKSDVRCGSLSVQFLHGRNWTREREFAEREKLKEDVRCKQGEA